MNLGIFGGSFNPIHLAHLIIAECALEDLKLDRVLFVPSNISPHKKNQAILDARHRLAMVRLATRDNPRFSVSDLEIRRGGVSFTIDTLRELRRRSTARFTLILGSDSLADLPKWREIDEIAGLVTFALATRPNLPPARMPMKKCRVQILVVPQMDVSGTDLRRRIKDGRSTRYLLHPNVERYIRSRGLYQV